MKKKKNVKNTTIDDLAIMVKHGFDQVDERFDQVNGKFSQVNGILSQLESGQEEIKLKLDNVAYRFELVELQKRVQLLEEKVGFKCK